MSTSISGATQSTSKQLEKRLEAHWREVLLLRQIYPDPAVSLSQFMVDTFQAAEIVPNDDGMHGRVGDRWEDDDQPNVR